MRHLIKKTRRRNNFVRYQSLSIIGSVGVICKLRVSYHHDLWSLVDFGTSRSTFLPELNKSCNKSFETLIMVRYYFFTGIRSQSSSIYPCTFVLTRFITRLVQFISSKRQQTIDWLAFDRGGIASGILITSCVIVKKEKGNHRGIMTITRLSALFSWKRGRRLRR